MFTEPLPGNALIKSVTIWKIGLFLGYKPYIPKDRVRRVVVNREVKENMSFPVNDRF
jgi:hypothetical protein